MRFWMILATLPLAACGGIASGSDSGTLAQPNGSGTTRTYAASDFTTVDLRGSDDVDVRVGGGFSIRAEGPSEDLDKLEIRKDGNTLKVGRKNERGALNWSRDGRKVKVYVTMPRIAGASVAGSGDLGVDKVAGDGFSGSIAGSGDLKVGALDAKSADFDIAGSGSIAASGRVESLKMAIAGSGNIDAPGLKASNADLSIAGSGNVRVDVNGPAKVTIMGSGDAQMGAGAKCTTTSMGSGTVRCG